ncbi:hypothetical protein [Cyanobacterium sp. uoEpiScrs1]|uniref:hypothetical protein n=1 Tax=Cyanobacterium sp. uoEpiScrs1 TaxID=2976343 RepID=UPI002269E643|nr:hypothetical protein [Cyanobacterium sp. uoEpiScrs1]
MPSSSGSPYKSKLFNFVNRHSLELRDNFGRVVRHLRVTAKWGTQILVFPLYLLVQAGRTVRRQLGQTVERISLSSEEISYLPLDSDRPLNKVLQTIKPWLASSEFLSIGKVTQTETDDSNLSHKFTIQGVASILDSCYLVLVKSNNQTVDVLSPSQQKILQKLIQVETANYLYSRRFKLTQSRKTPSLISSFSTNPQNVLPPVRWFWQGMRWMQTSPMAIKLNLFGESFLNIRIEHQPVSSEVKQSFKVNIKYFKEVIQKSKNYFYKHFKKLSYKVNQSINSYSINRSKELSSSQDKPKFFKKYIIKSNIKPIQELEQKLQKWTSRSLMAEKDNPFQLRMLIFAAIDYFFGQKTSGFQFKSKQSFKTIKSQFLSPSVSLHHANLTEESDDPCLSWNDLYLEETTSNLSKQFIALPQSSKEEVYSAKFLKKDLRIPFIKKHKNKQKKNKELNSTATIISNTYSALQQVDIQDNFKKKTSNWIETEAESTGYVEHPLENILEWLDMTMSWLEKLGSRLWKLLLRLIK